MNTKSSKGSEEEALDLSSEHDYIQLTDLPLISEASSSRKSSEKSSAQPERSVRHRRISTESTPAHNNDTSLSLRFENISAMITSILQHFDNLLHADKPDLQLDVKKLTNFLHFLRGVLLDLRIWSKDLTVNDRFALDRLDAIQQPGDKAISILFDLREIMSDIGEKLRPLTACLDNPPDHPRFMLELSSAHLELLAPFERLLSNKSAIKEVLRDDSTNKPVSLDRVVTMAQANKAPNVLCLGLCR